MYYNIFLETPVINATKRISLESSWMSQKAKVGIAYLCSALTAKRLLFLLLFWERNGCHLFLHSYNFSCQVLLRVLCEAIRLQRNIKTDKYCFICQLYFSFLGHFHWARILSKSLMNHHACFAMSPFDFLIRRFL